MSDILIKGAKMPKSCCECEGAYCDNNRWLCTLAGEYVDSFIYVECDRPTFCPLVEIPPHGDLIDKDKLINVLFDLLDDSDKPVHDMLLEVETAPTVIKGDENNDSND